MLPEDDNQRRTGSSLWISIAVVVAVQALFVWPSLSCLLDGLQDEGAIGAAATRVLDGQVPFRDFVSRMMPGTYYSVALWFACFGQSIEALRAYFFVSACLLAALVQAVSCRILPARWSELPALLFVATGVQFFPFASFHWDASIMSLAAILLLWGHEAHSRRELVAGVLCGFSVLFLQTKGLATCVGCGLSVLLARRPAWPSVVRLIAGAAAVGAPFVLGLLVSGAWGPFWAQTYGITKGNYALYQRAAFSTDVVWAQFGAMVHGMSGLSSPPTAAQVWWLFRGWAFALVDLVKYAGYYPVLLSGLLYLAYRWRATRERLSAQESHLLAVALVLALASVFDLVRANRYRLVLQMPFWSIILAVGLFEVYRRRRFAGLGLAGFVACVFAVHAVDNGLGWLQYRFPVRCVRGVVWARNPAVAGRAQSVMEVIARFTRPNDPIVGFPDVPLFVWLSGHSNPTHLDELFPVLTPQEDLDQAALTVSKVRPPLLLFFPLDPNLGGDYPALPADLVARSQDRLKQALTSGYVEHQGPGFFFYLPSGK